MKKKIKGDEFEKLSGSIHCIAYRADVINGKGKAIDERPMLIFTRMTSKGEKRFCTVYRHPSGEGVVVNAPGYCITADTMEKYILPTMKDFNKAFDSFELPVGSKEMRIGCSVGGCLVCSGADISTVLDILDLEGDKNFKWIKEKKKVRGKK